LIPLLSAADPLASHVRRLQALDGWRASAQTAPPQWTEWQHVVVVDGSWRLLLNFSLRVEEGKAVTRLLAMATGPGGWSGEVRPEPAVLRPGAVDCYFGASSFRLGPEGYQVELRTPTVEGHLHLEPIAAPFFVPGIRLDQGLRFHWLAVPRLVATGQLRVGGQTRRLHRVPAYHDHNWGRFSTGGNYAWEWGFLMPEAEEDPWSVLFLRVSDRARHRCRVQGMALWRDGGLFSSFRDGEIQTEAQGIWQPERVYLIPEQLAHELGSGGSMPRRFLMHAARGDDVLNLEVQPGALSRLLLPQPDGLTMVNEAAATGKLYGTIRGEPVLWNGAGMLEVTDG
jgi:hypothetical protein